MNPPTDHSENPSSVPRIDDVGVNLTPDVAKEVQYELAQLLNRGRNTGFPGAQPVSFARGHLQELKKRDYYVCEKSDGIRCLLYFTEAPASDGNGMMEAHYLVDRKNNYYYVDSLHFPRAAEPPSKDINYASYHTDTLLDGELLIDTEKDGSRVLKYLVFDCLMMDGQDLMSRTLDKRLAYFNDKVYQPYKSLCEKFPEDTSGFRFKMEKKSFQFAYGTEMMFKDILPKLKHGSDGLIFTCRETPYMFGTDEHILKWKPAWENTVDFKMELTFPSWDEPAGDLNGHADENGAADVWQFNYDAIPTVTLHAEYGDAKRSVPRTTYTLSITPSEWETMKAHAIATNDGLDGAIVECHREEDGTWHFNRFREDKTEGNYYTVVEKVLQSIEDGVTEEELIKGAGEVKAEWKRRAAEEAAARKQREIREAEEKAKKARAVKEAEEKARRAREAAKMGTKRNAEKDGDAVEEKRVKQGSEDRTDHSNRNEHSDDDGAKKEE